MRPAKKTDICPDLTPRLGIRCAPSFYFQFAARIWQSLPVSLLELIKFAHSLCALFIDVLW